MHYKMPWPNRELESARPFRRSPLVFTAADAGACFGSKMGWERREFLCAVTRAGTDRILVGSSELASHGSPRSIAPAASGSPSFDMSSFAKLLIKGRGRANAPAFADRQRPPARTGPTVYTGMLNERGGYESDFTVTMLDHDEYMVVTGSAQAVRDRDVIERAFWRLCRAAATAKWLISRRCCSVIAVMGPLSRELLQRVSTADFSSVAISRSAHRARSTLVMQRCARPG